MGTARFPAENYSDTPLFVFLVSPTSSLPVALSLRLRAESAARTDSLDAHDPLTRPMRGDISPPGRDPSVLSRHPGGSGDRRRGPPPGNPDPGGTGPVPVTTRPDVGRSGTSNDHRFHANRRRRDLDYGRANLVRERRWRRQLGRDGRREGSAEQSGHDNFSEELRHRNTSERPAPLVCARSRDRASEERQVTEQVDTLPAPL
jgi:hypothetical protein